MRNHYSHMTGVSIALPDDWREEREEDFQAIYLGPEPAPGTPRIAIRVFRSSPQQPAAYREVAHLAIDPDLPGLRELEASELKVDGFPAISRTVTFDDQEDGISMVHRQVVVQVGQNVAAILCMVGQPLAERYLPLFDRAVRSIRFIPNV